MSGSPAQREDPTETAAGRRFGVDPVLCVALFGELLLALLLNGFGDFSVGGNATRFVAIALAAGVCYGVAAARFQTTRAAWRPALLWGGAVAVRLAVLFMPPGDDIWRYLWEGKIQGYGANPYLLSPDSPALAALREGWWNAIGHRDYAAIYPPGVEWIFARLWGKAATGGFFPVLLFKSIFALADLGTLWVLLKLNTGSRRHGASAWYAWNPAVAIAFAGAGHYDSLMLLPLTASALFLHRANPLGNCKPSWNWAFLSALLLGLAISIKTVPLLLLPVWAFALGRRSVVLAVSVALPVAFAWPFGGLDVVTRSLGAFPSVAWFDNLWAFDWLNPALHNTRYVRTVVFVAVAFAFVFRHDWRRGALWVLGVALLLTRVFHPWHVCWVLPFACWRKVPAWFLFSLTALLALLARDAAGFGPAWRESSPWLKLLLMLGPPLLWLVRERVRRHREPAAISK